jgi:aspartate kinase
MKKLVLKFGGSILTSPEKIWDVVEIIQRGWREDIKFCIVVSAFRGITNQLIAMGKDFNENPPLQEMDALISTGENVSAALLAIALMRAKIPAISLTGAQAGITTDSHFSDGSIVDIYPQYILELTEQNIIPVIAGFQGSDRNGRTVTLGRGGSDLTAVAIGVSINADEVIFYKDTGGIYNPDNLQILPHLSYDEAIHLVQESDHEVICKKAIEYANYSHIKLKVCSVYKSFEEHVGTVIWDQSRFRERNLLSH